jgi:hypothetical protein
VTKILPSPILPVLAALQDRLDAAVDVGVLDDDLDLHLGQEVDHVLGAAVQLGVALLAAETLHLGHGQAGHADLGQRLANLFELEGFDDGGDLLHGQLRKRCTRRSLSAELRRDGVSPVAPESCGA